MEVFSFVSLLPRQCLFAAIYFANILKLLTRLYGKHLLACIKEFFFNTNKLRLICTFAILSLFVLLVQFRLLNFEIVCLLFKYKYINKKIYIYIHNYANSNLCLDRFLKIIFSLIANAHSGLTNYSCNYFVALTSTKNTLLQLLK